MMQGAGMRNLVADPTLKAGLHHRDPLARANLNTDLDPVMALKQQQQAQAAAAAAAAAAGPQQAAAEAMMAASTVQLQQYRALLQILIACFVLAVSWALLFSPKSRDSLRKIGKPVLVQLGLVSVLLLLPVLWWRYNKDGIVYPQTSVEYPNATAFTLASSKFLVSSGICLLVAGSIYNLCPLDLIPEFSPRIGRINDVLAGAVMGWGLAMCVLGYSLGSGPIPSEIDIVARAIRSVLGLVKPWLELLGPFVRSWLNFGSEVSKLII